MKFFFFSLNDKVGVVQIHEGSPMDIGNIKVTITKPDHTHIIIKTKRVKINDEIYF